jgi:hypothetical protein
MRLIEDKREIWLSLLPFSLSLSLSIHTAAAFPSRASERARIDLFVDLFYLNRIAQVLHYHLNGDFVIFN